MIVMKARSQRVTVALDEAVVKWLRREAARQNKSLSGVAAQIISDHVRNQSIDEDSYNRSMKRMLARKPFLKSDGKYPTREEIYDRHVVANARLGCLGNVGADLGG
jgi:hypothetical protein